MLDNMSGYDRKAWDTIVQWRARRLNSAQRHVLPKAARDRLRVAGAEVQQRLGQLPGAEVLQQTMRKSVDGVLGTVNRAAVASVRQKAVLAAFAKRGHEVEQLSDISALELRTIDQIKPRLDLRYTLASGMEGAGAGLAVAGGEIIATGSSVASAGAAAAPSALAIAGILAADVVAVLVAATRAVGHTAAYYGYDTELADERLYALGVLNFGLSDQAGKSAAYLELNKIVQALARNATWHQLDKNAVTRVVKMVYSAMGEKITKKKLGQALPVIGIVIGAGLNMRTLAAITSDADHLYRERFLREKYGPADESASVTASSPAPEQMIAVSDIISTAIESTPHGPEKVAE